MEDLVLRYDSKNAKATAYAKQIHSTLSFSRARLLPIARGLSGSVVLWTAGVSTLWNQYKALASPIHSSLQKVTSDFVIAQILLRRLLQALRNSKEH